MFQDVVILGKAVLKHQETFLDIGLTMLREQQRLKFLETIKAKWEEDVIDSDFVITEDYGLVNKN